MIELVKIVKLKNDKKKYKAIFKINDKTKEVKFGASGYEDYTIHKDSKRKELYVSRHKKDLKTNDPTKAGYLSMFILWNKPSLKDSIDDYKKRLKSNNWKI